MLNYSTPAKSKHSSLLDQIISEEEKIRPVPYSNLFANDRLDVESRVGRLHVGEDVVEFLVGHVGVGHLAAGLDLVEDDLESGTVRFFTGQKIEDGVVAVRVEGPAVAVL